MTGAATVALVIGGGHGIGRATAQRLSAGGASLIVGDLDLEAADVVAKSIRQSGSAAIAHVVDVSIEESVEELVAHTVRQFGRLDWAVNVVGVTTRSAPLAALTLAEFRQVMEVNLTGMFLAMRQELLAMLPNASGAIVNVSSAAGLVAVPGAAAYTASKHAVIGLTKAAAIDYVRHGIRINCVAPSHIDTNMIRSLLGKADDPISAEATLLSTVPAGRLGRPDDVASGIAYLLSDAAAFVSGSVLSIDGGYVAV